MAALCAAQAAVAVAVAYASGDSPLRFALALAATAVTVLLLAALADDTLRIRRTLIGIGEAEPGNPVRRLCAEAERMAVALKTVEQRLLHRHPVSGLPTREPLLRTIAQAGSGTLGLLHFADLDRLHAFDEQGADALLAQLAARVTAMVGERRLVAQVDRARVAIWYDADTPEGTARGQLDAIGYALGDQVTISGREVLPEVRVAAVPAAPEIAPSALLARAIAGGGGPAEAAAASGADPLDLARERFALEQDLRRAVVRGELELHYQPLVDAQAGRVCGAEALLRWRHPTLGLVPPTRFVPIMEAAGLADEIGLWALNAACREARALDREGFGPLRVAVNVSRSQLDQQDLPALVVRTLARHSLSPEALEIELTETLATADPARDAGLFEQLRALGVAIAIDDFGTGYSSFGALRTLRFDKIKIDREFVSAVDRRRDSQAICRSILALGQGLGIRVLAEGVESADEYRWLRAQGCQHFQGYYFARPLTPAGFRAFARDVQTLRGLLNPPAPYSLPERLSA